MAFAKHLMRSRITRLTLLLVLTTSAVALSFWRANGSGAAAGSAAATAPVVIAPALAGAELYPGGRADVLLTIANPNRFAVRVGTLALDAARGTGGFAVDAGHPACDPSTLSFTTQTGPWSIGPRVGSSDGSVSVTLSDALAMTASALSACQGASFIVYLAAGA